MLNFESSKIKFITWLLFLSLLAILSEAPRYNTTTCICSQNVKNTHLSITQTKTQIVDPYPKIRKQNPRNPKTKPSKISRNFLPPKIKRLLLGLVSYDIFRKDLLLWRGRYHVPKQMRCSQASVYLGWERPIAIGFAECLWSGRLKGHHFLRRAFYT